MCPEHEVLPLDAVRDPVLDLRWRRSRDRLAEDLPGVLGGLEHAGDVGGERGTEGRGVVLQLGQ